jgi:hypothetical protein
VFLGHPRGKSLLSLVLSDRHGVLRDFGGRQQRAAMPRSDRPHHIEGAAGIEPLFAPEHRAKTQENQQTD